MTVEITNAQTGAPELTWRFVVDATPPAGAHDLSAAPLALLKTANFPGPATSNPLDGYRVVQTVAVVFTGDRANTGDGYSLVAVVEDDPANILVASVVIGGEANDADPFGTPSTTPVASSAANNTYGAAINAPRVRLYTLGSPRIVGNVDLTELAYPGDLDTLAFSFTSDLGPIAGVFAVPANAADVAQQITDAAAGIAYAYVDGSNHLVVFSATRDATGTISAANDATNVILGIAGESAADGRPTFGDIDTGTAADVTITMFLSLAAVTNA